MKMSEELIKRIRGEKSNSQYANLVTAAQANSEVESTSSPVFFRQKPDVEFPKFLRDMGFEDHSWGNDDGALAALNLGSVSLGVWVLELYLPIDPDDPSSLERMEDETKFSVVLYNNDEEGNLDTTEDPKDLGWFKNLEDLKAFILKSFDHVPEIKSARKKEIKKEKLKRKKIQGDAMSKPSVYVGTYGKYNNGSIKGKWLNLEDYSDYEDFLKAAKELHSDEEDPELMFQDFEGFPRRYYSESGLGEKLWDWLSLDEDKRNLLEAYIDYTNDSDATIDQAESAFGGEYDSPADWAYDFIESSDVRAESLVRYIFMSDTDRRIIADEEASNYVDNLSDRDALEQAQMEDEHEAAADEDKDDIVEKAKDKIRDTEYERVYQALEDPYEYFVEETGAYFAKDLVDSNFIQIDYEAYARDSSGGGIGFQEAENGKVYVFYDR